MTPDFAELRALLAKATPGKWMHAAKASSVVGMPIVATPQGRSIGHVTHGPSGTPVWDAFNTESTANAALIVAAINALPALLDLAERAATDENGDPEKVPESIAARDAFIVSRGLWLEFVRQLPDRGRKSIASHVATARAEAIRECAEICKQGEAFQYRGGARPQKTPTELAKAILTLLEKQP